MFKRTLSPLSPSGAPTSTPHNRMTLLTFLVAGAMFMENLDGTIITTALPAMGRTFGQPAIALNVGISAYLIALGIFIPASGWAADRFGTRRVFALAIMIFTLSSALCGAADTLAYFVGMRILQGIAGAMMVPVGRLVVLKNTPTDKLMTAMATLVWPALIAPVLGPPLGGLITEHASWRWIFYLNVPLGVVALLVTLKILPDFRAVEKRPFDWTGFLLCGCGIFALLSGVERLASRPDILSIALGLAGIGLLAMAVRHFRTTAEPMIRLDALGIATFRVAMQGGSLLRMAIGSAPFLLPLMFQVGFGFSAAKAGLLMLGVFGSNFALKAVTNKIIRRLGFRTVLVWNGLLCVLALAACALLDGNTPLTLIIITLMIGGATRSMQFTALAMITFSDVPKPQMSGANGLSSTITQLSMGAGIAVGAMSVRAGHIIAQATGFTSAGADFRIAFLIVAGIALLGLIDAWRLAHDAGDSFTARKAA